MNFDVYPTWDAFLNEFLVKGGLIEGSPPSDSITSLSVDLFIDPVGEVKVLATHDQVGKRERGREGGREGGRVGGWEGGREGGREQLVFKPEVRMQFLNAITMVHGACSWAASVAQLVERLP